MYTEYCIAVRDHGDNFEAGREREQTSDYTQVYCGNHNCITKPSKVKFLMVYVFYILSLLRVQDNVNNLMDHRFMSSRH